MISKSISRNPFLFSLLERANYVERYGSGISRIEDLLKEKGLQKPYYESISLFFTIGFRRELINEPLNEHSLKVLNYIKKNPNSKREDILKNIEISLATLKRDIDILMQMNLIERKGSKKTGGYFVRK